MLKLLVSCAFLFELFVLCGRARCTISPALFFIQRSELLPRWARPIYRTHFYVFLRSQRVRPAGSSTRAPQSWPGSIAPADFLV